eukprot:TRINITY_DN5946_c0_g1_i1.p1 TRINITY_DN5946_c0_g1~~TRINITY_DN5946_c0_g1_i1.p1  ORF type:complete len:406 (+),score=109.03 TRINITY_DN5946_c0_g1_i1:71-1288(+)
MAAEAAADGLGDIPSFVISGHTPAAAEELDEDEEEDESDDEGDVSDSDSGADDVSSEGAIVFDEAGIPRRRPPLHPDDARRFADAERWPHLQKYYQQRYRLWSRFDEGVRMDEESWYSVTPEAIAQHTAARLRVCPHDVVIDAFSGSGGNTIQFAMVARHVIAIDIDPVKLALAQHNATVYGVRHKIDYVCGDYAQLLPHLEADVVFLSPPWGGPKYRTGSYFDLRDITVSSSGVTVQEIVRRTRELVTPNVVLFVPRNSLAEQLTALAPPGERVEIEQNVFNKKVKSVTAYYGALVADGKDGRRRINPPPPPAPPPVPIPPDLVKAAYPTMPCPRGWLVEAERGTERDAGGKGKTGPKGGKKGGGKKGGKKGGGKKGGGKKGGKAPHRPAAQAAPAAKRPRSSP